MITLPTTVFISIILLIIALLLFCALFIYKWSASIEEHELLIERFVELEQLFDEEKNIMH